MGFRKFFGFESTDGWVEATATVENPSGYRGRGVKQNCKMELITDAGTKVPWHGLVHRDKWPTDGLTVPILVNPEDPQNVDIIWDKVEKKADRA